MAALFNEFSSSSSSSEDERDAKNKEPSQFEMDFIPKSMFY